MGRKRYLLSLFIMFLGCCPAICRATPYNIAPLARASASSSIDADHGAAKAIDGVIRVPGKGEWVSVRKHSGGRLTTLGYSWTGNVR